MPSGQEPPGVVPPAGQPAWAPAEPLPPQRPQLDVGRYWAGAAATVLVCTLLGLAASVIFDEVFDIGLYAPPDAIGAGNDASWAGAGAVFALLAAVVLHLLVVIAPRPRMFFGWLVGLTTVILAVLPFTGNPDPLPGAMTGLVWVILGLAVSSMLGSVLSRTLSMPVTTT
ncbi:MULTISPECIES: hypothetical protein [Isoptericola]|uniref:hypothetical protein n=1 Tax=Isoptericola TaxID=254250 RepID=UPI00383A2E87